MDTEKLYEIPLVEIWSDEDFNSRGAFSSASVATLADDIEREGLLEPIIVQELPNPKLNTKYKIIMGHRRFAAHRLLARSLPKYSTIKSRIFPPTDPATALIMNLKENMEREPLNMLQEAKALVRFRDWGWDAKKVAASLGQSRKWVETRWALLTLPREVQERARDGFLNQYQVDQATQLASEEQQFQYIRNIVDHKMRGTKINEKKKGKKLKTTITAFAQGTARSQADLAVMQEAIQDSWGDNAHPAASALAWAAGIISDEQFFTRLHALAASEGVTFIEPEEIKA